MDKDIKKTVGDVVSKGEKMAPVKSVKLKVKFQDAKSKALKKLAKGKE